MSNFNITNVKDLPQLEQILAGNYLIVENNVGTNKLDFADFVIGPTNTSFYNTLANDIVGLSASNISLTSQTSSLSTGLVGLSSIVASNSSNIQTLSSRLGDATNRFLVRREIMSMAQGSNTIIQSILVPSNILIYNSDIIVSRFDYTSPTPGYELKLNTKDNFFVWGLSGVPVNNGDNTTYTLFVSSTVSAPAQEFFTYTLITPEPQQ